MIVERIEDAIDICNQLSKDTDLKSCEELLHKIKFSSLEDLKKLNHLLQDAKLSYYIDLKIVHGKISEAEDKQEIVSELKYLLEQSFNWWTIYDEKISKCDNNVKQINNKLEDIKFHMTKLVNKRKSLDFQSKMKNLICLLHLEERQLRVLWDDINSLLGNILEPIPFVDTECLESKVHSLRDDFYILEGGLVNCLKTCERALEPTKCSEVKSELAGIISVKSTVLLISLFIIISAVIFIILVTLMMDDVLSPFIWVHHDQIAPS